MICRYRPHRRSPRLILPGQLIHESVYELIKSTSKAQPPDKSYLPIALLPSGKKWQKDQLPEGHIIESDPYLQPDRILDAIKEKRQVPAADFTVLFTLSSTGKCLSHYYNDILTVCIQPLVEGLFESALTPKKLWSLF